MRKQARLIGVIVIVWLGCERAQDTSVRSSASAKPSASKSALPADPAGGAFAHVDSSGTELLALDSLRAPSTILAAICGRTAAMRVQHVRKQPRQAADNGRQVASNFRNEGGDVFRIIQGSAPPDKTCYLSTDTTLVADARSASIHEPTDCVSAQISRVAAARRRAVMHCWRIADGPPGLEVLAVQFATIDSSALASLALVSDAALMFKDFPAVYRGTDGSTWRVDDGGVFSPKDFDILFIAQTSSGFAMAFTWAGAEGESSELVIASSAGEFRTLSKGYRYWAPA